MTKTSDQLAQFHENDLKSDKPVKKVSKTGFQNVGGRNLSNVGELAKSHYVLEPREILVHARICLRMRITQWSHFSDKIVGFCHNNRNIMTLSPRIPCISI